MKICPEEESASTGPAQPAAGLRLRTAAGLRRGRREPSDESRKDLGYFVELTFVQFVALCTVLLLAHGMGACPRSRLLPRVDPAARHLMMRNVVCVCVRVYVRASLCVQWQDSWQFT